MNALNLASARRGPHLLVPPFFSWILRWSLDSLLDSIKSLTATNSSPTQDVTTKRIHLHMRMSARWKNLQDHSEKRKKKFDTLLPDTLYLTIRFS